MAKKKGLTPQQQEILSKVVFKDYQVKALQSNVELLFNKKVSHTRAMLLLKKLYFMDAKETLIYLEEVFKKKKS